MESTWAHSEGGCHNKALYFSQPCPANVACNYTYPIITTLSVYKLLLFCYLALIIHLQANLNSSGRERQGNSTLIVSTDWKNNMQRSFVKFHQSKSQPRFIQAYIRGKKIKNNWSVLYAYSFQFHIIATLLFAEFK